MWKKINLWMLLIVFLATSALGAPVGDPLDEQDSAVVLSSTFSDANCTSFIQYPDCQSCWFMCLQALLVDAFMEAQWDDF